MELKDRKRITSGFYKKYEDGKEGKSGGFSGFMTNVSPYLSAALFVTGLAADAINAVPTVDDLFSDAGTSTKYTNGISYLSVNDIDSDQYIKDYKKGAIFNPFKWFGLGKTKKRLSEFNKEKTAINTAAMAGASTDYLQQEYAKEYGNPLSLMLYAKNGKDAVQTSRGETSGVYNSMTAENESIVSGDNTYAHQNTRPSNGDTLKSYVEDDDTVFTAQDNFNVAKYVKPAVKAIEFMNNSNIKNGGSLRDITELINRREADYLIENGKAIQRLGRRLGIIGQPKIKKYYPGKDNLFFNWMENGPILDTRTPKEFFDQRAEELSVKPIIYNKGPLSSEVYDGASKTNYNPKQPEQKKGRRLPSNWWIDGLGALTHMGGLISDATQRIKRSNTYAENPYASNALNELASLRIDPYSINKQLMDQQRRNLYAINRAGGLSGAQKAYANIASGLGALGTIAASNADIQKQNNAYRSAYASAALNAGQADRAARIQANQWDLDYYSKAHGAKRQEIQQDIYNALAALQQGYANSWKRYSFDKMMSLYDNSYA